MIKELVFEKQKWVNQKDYLSKDYVNDNYVSKSEQSLIGKTVHVATPTPVFCLTQYSILQHTNFDRATVAGEDKSINAGDYTISGEYQGNWINVLNDEDGWINLDTVIQNGGSVR